MPKTKKQFDFIGKRKIFLAISLAVMLVGLIFNIAFGTQLDIDFKGGTLFTYSYTGEMTEESIKDIVKETIDLDSDISFSSDLSGETKNFTVTLVDDLDNKYVYSYTGTVDAEAVKTAAATALGTDVTVTAQEGVLTILPTDNDIRIPDSSVNALTAALEELLPDNEVALTYTNSVTDIAAALNSAIAEKFGSKLVYTLSAEMSDMNADNIEGSLYDILGFSALVTKTEVDGVHKLEIVPYLTANTFGDQVSKVTEAVTAVDASAALESSVDNGITLLESNSVKPTIGKGFFIKCIFAVVLGAILVTIYVGIRFRKIGGISAAVFAMLALVHDVIITYFVYVIFGIPLNDNFIAVILTLLGYSLNDTIVIYDRVRENERLYGNTKTISELVNMSVNQCFTRNINTSLATFAAIMVVFVVTLLNGITSMISFALPMAIGIIAGCYSSVLLSSPMWAAWRERKLKKAADKADK